MTNENINKNEQALVVAAFAGGVAIAGFIGKIIYDKVKGGDSNSSNNEPNYNIFLTGELGVGKDTIYHILKDGKFATWDSTPKIEKYSFDIFDSKLCVINTAGARHNDEENIEARRNLLSGTRYIYVFNAYDYFTNAEIKKQVNLDIETHKELCNKNHWNLKTIGTHKDICLKNGISEAEIQALASEIGGETQILDLTNYNDSQGQENLYNFIIGKD